MCGGAFDSLRHGSSRRARPSNAETSLAGVRRTSVRKQILAIGRVCLLSRISSQFYGRFEAIVPERGFEYLHAKWNARGEFYSMPK